MKLHTDRLQRSEIVDACRGERFYVQDICGQGSRSRHHGFLVYLGGSAPHASQHDRSVKAATYEEWGWFLAKLYALDEELIAGPYKGVQDFHEVDRVGVLVSGREEWVSSDGLAHAEVWADADGRSDHYGKPRWSWRLAVAYGCDVEGSDLHGWGPASRVLESLGSFVGAWDEAMSGPYPDSDNRGLFPAEAEPFLAYADEFSCDMAMSEEVNR